MNSNDVFLDLIAKRIVNISDTFQLIINVLSWIVFLGLHIKIKDDDFRLDLPATQII